MDSEVLEKGAGHQVFIAPEGSKKQARLKSSARPLQQPFVFPSLIPLLEDLLNVHLTHFGGHSNC